jgi:predicted alpha/beta-fold hydrolase
MWTFGVKTPFEYIKSYTNYSLKDVIQNIKCPTLVLEAEDDQFFKGQPKQVYDNLKCTKDYILFKNSEGAGDHCQIAALSLSNQRIFDWLDKNNYLDK